MQPQFSAAESVTAIRTDSDGVSLMPEWSDGDVKQQPEQQAAAVDDTVAPSAQESSFKKPRKEHPKKLPQPEGPVTTKITEAKQWLIDHPEEAEMLRLAQKGSSGDILADAGVDKRYYSTKECASFFDRSVGWLYWGMGHHLFVEEEDGTDIPIRRVGDPKVGTRRFDIPTIRKMAKSAYYQGNIKEPKLAAVLQRLLVAERGGNWKSIPLPVKEDDEDERSFSAPATPA